MVPWAEQISTQPTNKGTIQQSSKQSDETTQEEEQTSNMPTIALA